MSETTTPTTANTNNGIADIRARFGLHSIPFTREVDIKSRWGSEVFDDPLEDLQQVIESRMSGLLVAPAGTGKTSLLRTIAELLPEVRHRTHYVKVTNLSKRDFCREIAAAVGLEPAGTYPNLVRKLQERFDNVDASEALRPVLFIDDAHEMRPDVLSVLAVLTNFDMDSRLVVSVILSGQPPLTQLLARCELEAVRHRIAHCATLRLLSREETRSYMEHRMTTAGARTFPFDPQAVEAVYETSRGNLRAIDQVARKSLHLAAKANASVVDTPTVIAARKWLLQ